MQTTHSNSLPSVRHIQIRPAREWVPLELAELWHFRDLLTILMMRDVKLRYKQTALGIAWVVLQPLIASLIFTVIFGRFAKLPSDGMPYLLFAFSGILPWNLSQAPFSEQASSKN